MENQEAFEYTYSASEQEEIRAIREKYLPRDSREEKLEKLRRLDARVSLRATMASVVLGVVSSLIFGLGLCCCLVWGLFWAGIPLGGLGILGICLAYPLHRYMENRERRRAAPLVLKLTEELL